MCEHCEKVNEVLTEVAGAKVAGVIMRRVDAKLHPVKTEDVQPAILLLTR